MRTESGAALFEAEGLELRFGEQLAFAVPRLLVEEGERLALLGPNGSGKTTVLKAMGGLLAPCAGSLRFMGEPVLSSRRLRERCVYMHQHPYILAGTVAYNVTFGCRSRHVGREQGEARAREAMRILGLEGFGRRRSRALSGGESQRVALARALAAGADVLLLDEPTASADADSRDLILEALRARARTGATLIFSTHDPGLARQLATRVILLDRGSVADDRPVDRAEAAS
ncbi:MAG TPA: ABC transporter ATP-binding protein [Rectinemataceae bacterium]|nr:ABC transporter ATP-binding protein [Rectinemataceae bacterium]